MGLRWLVVLVAVAVAIDISQGLLHTFKQQREKNFKRYLEGVNEKRAAMKKRHMGGENDCPLWDCYGYDDDDYYYYSDRSEGSGSDSSEEMDYMMYYVDWMQTVRQCQKEQLANGSLCDCSIQDLYWCGIFDEVEEMPNPNDTCWQCLGKFPEMDNPGALHFSCDAGKKIDEVEECFNKVEDQSCLAKAMGGIEMDPKIVFGGIRMEVAGCPLSDIVMDCMGFNDASYRNEYTSCLMEYVDEEKDGSCVTQWLQEMEFCKEIPAEVYPQIVEGCKKGREMMCKPFGAAIEMKTQCCPAEADAAPADVAESAPAVRKLSNLLRMIKKGH